MVPLLQIPPKSLKTSISTPQTTQLFTPFSPSKRHQNRLDPCIQSRTPTLQINVVLDNNYPNAVSFSYPSICRTLSSTTSTFDCHRQPNFHQRPYFRFIFPSFHPEFRLKTTSLYSLLNDSCVAMKHATCQQRKSEVHSSVTNFSL